MENLEVNAQVAEETTATQSVKKSNGKNFFVAVGKRVREFFRKLMVSLKRRPHNIALIMLAVSFMVYSFNLGSFSDTTAYIYGNGMGLCEFAIMLFSTLSFVCFLNAFPNRAKPKIIMIILLGVMIAVVITCDVIYYLRIQTAIKNAIEAGEEWINDSKFSYVFTASKISVVHIILLGVSALLTATIPLYGKLFKLVNTNVELEYTEADEQVELAEEA